jgi:toxin HigB-1
VLGYTLHVIRGWQHKGLREFFLTGSKKGIQPKHAAKLQIQLVQLDQAKRVGDMGAPGWGLHPLQGELAGHWAVWVSGNWRLTFRFEDEHADMVDYHDYH